MNKLKIIVATQNAGKVKELAELLADLPISLGSLKDFPAIAEPAETGETFIENAALKASYYALQTGAKALADDSGLEVEALGGAPGIFSARYAGEGASDAERTEKLLRELEKTGDEKRVARFVCAVALADETGKILHSAKGICDGKIALAPRGNNGFGYDPVFIPAGFSITFSEMKIGQKQQISHRAQAIAKIIAFLRGFDAP